VTVVLPEEGDAVLLHGDEATIGERDAGGVAGEVTEDEGGATERGLRVDDPVLLVECGEERAEGVGVDEVGKSPAESESVAVERLS
jgi:hypothetical protein